MKNLSYSDMKDQGEIFSAVSSIIKDIIDVDVVKSDDNLKNNLNMDSLHIVELAMNIEKEFNITLTDADIDGLKTAQNCVDVVSKYLNE